MYFYLITWLTLPFPNVLGINRFQNSRNGILRAPAGLGQASAAKLKSNDSRGYGSMYKFMLPYSSGRHHIEEELFAYSGLWC